MARSWRPSDFNTRRDTVGLLEFEADVELWFTRDGMVPIRDQLVTQLMLAIASGELPCGKRLPSTRALAKRFQLNANTVSAAYQQLQSLGWVKSVRGSGVYVRAKQDRSEEGSPEALDGKVLTFLRSVRSTGVTANTLRKRIEYWLGMRPQRFVFVHPEPSLRAIICRELRETLTWQIEDCKPGAEEIEPYLGNSIFMTVPTQYDTVCPLISTSAELIALQVRQVDRALRPYLPIRAAMLIVVASAWSGFLEIARAMLAAVGCDSEAVVFRDTTSESWQRGLRSASVVVCDVLTAAEVPEGLHKIVFRLISEASVHSLRTCERFFSN